MNNILNHYLNELQKSDYPEEYQELMKDPGTWDYWKRIWHFLPAILFFAGGPFFIVGFATLRILYTNDKECYQKCEKGVDKWFGPGTAEPLRCRFECFIPKIEKTITSMEKLLDKVKKTNDENKEKDIASINKILEKLNAMLESYKSALEKLKNRKGKEKIWTKGTKYGL